MYVVLTLKNEIQSYKEWNYCVPEKTSNLCVANRTVMVKRLLVVKVMIAHFVLCTFFLFYKSCFLSSLQLLLPVISNIKTWLSTTLLVPFTVLHSTGWQERTNFANLIFEFLWELLIIWEAIWNIPFSVSPDIQRPWSLGCLDVCILDDSMHLIHQSHLKWVRSWFTCCCDSNEMSFGWYIHRCCPLCQSSCSHNLTYSQV